MKLTFLLTVINVMAIMANGFSQTSKITLNLQNSSLKEVFSAIENQTNFSFLFKTDAINQNQKVDLQVSGSNLDEVLTSLFKNRNIKYQILDNSLIVLLPTSNTLALQQKLSGTVSDALNGEAIIGANVLIEGTTIGVVTDANGKFSIEISKPDAVLLVSFLGYNPERVTVGGQSVLNVKLVPDITKLDEVVVIGYGTQKRTTLSGAVSTLKGSEIASVPVSNVSNMLTGRVPGLIAYTNSSEPGNDKANLLIRGKNTTGDNSPLIVVDGIANREFEHIDPNDIESMTVLKDASAAIYGAQAANGVILITTKRGKTGKPSITLTLNQGYNAPTRLPEMADAFTYASMVNEVTANSYSADAIQKYKDGSDPLLYPNTNWYKATIKPWSVQKNANVTVNGGSESLKYLVSFGAKYNDGVYKSSASNYTQYNFRSNIDGKINKYINIGFDVAGRQENLNNPNSDIYTIFRSIIRGKPTMIATWPNGEPGPATEGGAQSVILTTDQPGYNHKVNYFLETNLKLNVIIPGIKGLSVTGNFAFDKNFSNKKSWNVPYNLYNIDGMDAQNQPVLKPARYGPPLPSLGQTFEDYKNITMNALVNYEFSVAKNHNFKIMVGSERHTYNKNWLSANRGNFLSPALSQMFVGAKDLLMTNDGNVEDNARLNYFGRVNYNFSEKFLAEFVWRYDGSSLFPANSQFGFFPGVSLGYRISEESFFKNNVSFVNNLKIRGSWGQTGNDRIDPYQFLSTYTLNDYAAVFGSTPAAYKATYEKVIPNYNVTWEVANQRNIGLEGSILNNKLSFEIDYFNNKRDKLLLPRNASIPGLAGLRMPDENIGKVTNVGFDGVITYKDHAGDFNYMVSLNITTNKNTVDFWDETAGLDSWQRKTGYPIGWYDLDANNKPTIDRGLYYQADGIFHTQEEATAYNDKFKGKKGILPSGGVVPGDVRFIDVNNDGTIDALDRERSFKSIVPTLTGGMQINLGYKNFDLSFLLQGARGAVTYLDNTEAGNLGNYLKEYADNRWTPTNTETNYPRTWDRTNMYWTQQRNTFWLKSTDYIRLKSVEIGFNTGARVNKSLGISGLRIYLNGFNLLTFDKLGIYDPEGAAANGQFYIYPMNKTVNAGIKLTF